MRSEIDCCDICHDYMRLCWVCVQERIIQLGGEAHRQAGREKLAPRP